MKQNHTSCWQMAEESFRESFKNALLYLFTFGDTSANVDRVVQFVATFCTTLDDEEEFLLFIFDIIFNVSIDGLLIFLFILNLRNLLYK